MPNFTKKLDKSEVNYRNGDHCGMCEHFAPDDDGTDEVEGAEAEEGWCQIVKGRIGEDMLCDRFVARPGGERPEDDDESMEMPDDVAPAGIGMSKAYPR